MSDERLLLVSFFVAQWGHLYRISHFSQSPPKNALTTNQSVSFIFIILYIIAFPTRFALSTYPQGISRSLFETSRLLLVS